jgi:xylan 1,4-beta-xylosidase
VTADGDGGGGLVSALASRDGDDVGVLVWNSSLDQSRMPADPLLARDVTLTVTGLSAGDYDVAHARVDERHSNVFAAWHEMGGADRDWPTDDEWAQLRSRDDLAELEPVRRLTVAGDGQLTLTFPLPQPGISMLTLRPH